MTGVQSPPLVTAGAACWRPTGKPLQTRSPAREKSPATPPTASARRRRATRRSAGQFSIGTKMCAEPRVDPLLTVTYAYLEKGVVTQAISGPFDLGRPNGCPPTANSRLDPAEPKAGRDRSTRRKARRARASPTRSPARARNKAVPATEPAPLLRLKRRGLTRCANRPLGVRPAHERRSGRCGGLMALLAQLRRGRGALYDRAPCAHRPAAARPRRLAVSGLLALIRSRLRLDGRTHSALRLRHHLSASAHRRRPKLRLWRLLHGGRRRRRPLRELRRHRRRHARARSPPASTTRPPRGGDVAQAVHRVQSSTALAERDRRRQRHSRRARRCRRCCRANRARRGAARRARVRQAGSGPGDRARARVDSRAPRELRALDPVRPHLSAGRPSGHRRADVAARRRRGALGAHDRRNAAPTAPAPSRGSR